MRSQWAKTSVEFVAHVPPSFFEGSAGVGGNVPADDGEARSDQALGNGTAHESKADETDGAVGTNRFRHCA